MVEGESEPGGITAALGQRPAPTLEEAAALEELTSRLFAKQAKRPELARYRILHPIGEGGLGVVFAAHDPTLDRKVAVKLVRRDNHDDKALARLTREAQTLAKLSHPAIVQVFDLGWYELGDLGPSAPNDVPSSGFFIVMELLQGQDMKHWLAAGRSRPEILQSFLAAGEGLAAGHRAGVVHRDFKPANVIVLESGHAKVLDFGLAYDDRSRTDPSESGPTEELLTQTGTVMGTPLYMAPEQYRGDAADARSDQYSFCLSLAEALAKRRLIQGDSLAALQESKLSLTLAGERAIPRRLRRTLARGLSPDPARRFETMPELLAELRRSDVRKTSVVAAVGLLGLGAMLWGAREPEATAAVEVDCDAEASAVVERLHSSRAIPQSGPQALRDAIASRAAEEDRRLHDQLVETCEAGEELTLAAVSKSCVAARDAKREALMSTLADSGQERGPGLAAAIRAVSANDTCVRTEPESVPAQTVMGHLGRAEAFEMLHDFEAAEREIRTAVDGARQHSLPRLEARALLALGKVVDRKQPGEGVDEMEQAYFLAEKIGDAEAATLAAARMTWAGARYRSPDVAERWFGHARTQLQRAQSEGLPVEELQGQVAWAALGVHDQEAAVEHAEEALRLHAEAGPDDDLRSSMYLGLIAHAAGRLGDMDRAEAMSRREVAALKAALGEDHPDVADALGTVAASLINSERGEEAVPIARRSLEILEEWFPETDVQRNLALARLGAAQAAAGRHRDAIDSFELALSRFEDRPETQHYFVELDMSMARSFAALGAHEDTVAHAEAGKRRAEQLGRPGDRNPADADALIATATKAMGDGTSPKPID